MIIRLTKDKSFYNNFFSLFALLVLQNILVLSMSLADNLMLGSYSQNALSGAAAVNQVQFVFNQLIMAVGDSLVVLCSQYWGQKRTSPIRRAAPIAMFAALIVAIAFFLLASFIPRQLISLFTNNTDYIDAGVDYIGIIKYTYLLFAISNTLLALMRSVETVRVAFYISIVSLVLNCGINRVLIFGEFGMPEMGVRGAAVGTLAARCAEFVAVLLYVFFKDKKLKVKFGDFFKFDRALAHDYVRLSRQFLLVSFLFGINVALQTVILGHMNDSAIAANSAASTIFMFLKVMSVGSSAAASIVIGKTVGAGLEKKAKEYAITLEWIFFGVGLLTSACLLLIRVPILSLYSGLSEEALKLANRFLLILSFTCIGTAYQFPTLCGIVRGGGDASFVLKNDLISIWGIVLPLSALGAFVFGFPPELVMFCLNSDQVFKCGAAFIKCNRFHWMKKLTRQETAPSSVQLPESNQD